MLALPDPYYRDEAVTIYHSPLRRDPGTAGCPRTAKGWLSPSIRVGYRVSGFHLPEPLLSLLDHAPAVLWGANHYSDCLPRNSRWLVWDKRDGSATADMSDCELAWTSLPGVSVQAFRHYWSGMLRASERGPRQHPTQKPVALMKWVLGLAKLEPGALVLDPYTGSGPVLRACKDLGYRAIGIDSLEWCCERAAERCRQEVLSLHSRG